jgi:hypothetical protein
VASQAAKPPAIAARPAPPPPPAVVVEQPAPPVSQPAGAGGSVKDTYLDEIRRARGAFHGSVVAQAQRIEFESDRIVFQFSGTQTFQSDQVWQNKDWLEKLALQVAGRRLAVVAQSAAVETGTGAAGSPGSGAAQAKQAADLKAEALANPAVQAMLGIFAADITDVTELKKKS